MMMMMIMHNLAQMKTFSTHHKHVIEQHLIL